MADLFGIGAIGGAAISSAANIYMARRQMEFQEKMSSSAHQREVHDLRAAGLNPVLSATGGKGATTPPGAMPEVGDPIGAGINTALAARKNRAETELMDAQARKAAAEADQSGVVAELYKALGPRIMQGIGAVESGAKSLGELGGRVEEAIRGLVRDVPNIRERMREAPGELVDMVKRQLGIYPMPAAKSDISDRQIQERMGVSPGASAKSYRKPVEEGEGSGRSRGVNPKGRPHYFLR